MAPFKIDAVLVLETLYVAPFVLAGLALAFVVVFVLVLDADVVLGSLFFATTGFLVFLATTALVLMVALIVRGRSVTIMTIVTTDYLR